MELAELRELARICNEALEREYAYFDMVSPTRLTPGDIRAILPILGKATSAKRPAQKPEAAMNSKNETI